jgi:hypothetical protein
MATTKALSCSSFPFHQHLCYILFLTGSTLIAVAAAWAAPWMSGLERFAGELHSS